MENASKALLIAAVVLIVILIIAFGIKIFNSTSGATSSAVSTGETIISQTGQSTKTTITEIQDATSSVSKKEKEDEKLINEIISYGGDVTGLPLKSYNQVQALLEKVLEYNEKNSEKIKVNDTELTGSLNKALTDFEFMKGTNAPDKQIFKIYIQQEPNVSIKIELY